MIQKRMTDRFMILVCLLTGFVWMTGGCKKNVLSSLWIDRDISVDGDYLEWQNNLTYFEDEDVSVGFTNDETYFYLALVTGNRDLQRQVMGTGLILWLDIEGKKNKTFGIKYPLGIMSDGMTRRDMNRMERGSSDLDGCEPDLEKMRERFENNLNELEMLGSGKDDINRMAISELKETKICAGLNEDVMVLELKVPLKKSGTVEYALGIEAGSMLGVGFETPEINRDEMTEEMKSKMGGGRPGGGRSGGGMGGGMWGGGTRGGGMRGGGMPGGEPQMPDAFKTWMVVQLAADAGSEVMESVE